ncbi:hypothetical protein M422DRAFT_158706, partial [Sphaerobolus stellatus SS14]
SVSLRHTMATYLPFILLLASIFIYELRRRRLKLPPGPKGLPIVGNWFQLPGQRETVKTYNRWAEQYGDIVHVKDFGRYVFILNSLKAVDDLLEKRSTIYSSRPQFIMFHELMGFGETTAFLPYGDKWRKHRILFNQQMNKRAIDQFEGSQYEAIGELLRSILDSPTRTHDHFRHMTGSIVLRFAYGYKAKAKDDPIYGVLNSNGAAFARAIIPGAFLVDNIPILRYVPGWFPGTEFQRFATETRKRLQHSRELPFQRAKAELRAGNAPPSFMANALTELGTDDESNEDVQAVKWVANAFWAAGTDTTAATIAAFVRAMSTFPRIMKKAQKEIDEAVGHTRLPEFSDRPALPYLDAILKETMRWAPIFPAALPHSTTVDDVYEGYQIPAGSIVIPNVWRILKDPGTYPDPSVFRPERFLPDENGGICEKDPTLTGAFGYGRRICAGKNLAEATVWLTIATLLWAFDFSNPRDENGKKLDPKEPPPPRAFL